MPTGPMQAGSMPQGSSREAKVGVGSEARAEAMERKKRDFAETGPGAGCPSWEISTALTEHRVLPVLSCLLPSLPSLSSFSNSHHRHQSFSLSSLLQINRNHGLH